MYWKFKFFEFLCSNCGYSSTDEEVETLERCPRCGESVEDDEEEEYPDEIFSK